jgi:hypothetical protein
MDRQIEERGQVVSEPEHIRPILRRVFQQLEKDWEERREEEKVEVKDQEHNTPTGQI